MIIITKYPYLVPDSIGAYPQTSIGIKLKQAVDFVYY